MSEPGEFVVEGRIAVEALVSSRRFEVTSVLLEEGRHPGLPEFLSASGVPFAEQEAVALRAESGYDFHRGVLARAARPVAQNPSAFDFSGWSKVLFPLELADPGNLGTIVRSGAAFGADAILVERGRGADIWSRKSIRASATAVFRVPVFEVSDPQRILELAAAEGFVSFGTSLSGEATPLREVRPARKSLVLLGSESEGLGPALEAACDELIRIPMAQGMDSLNVAATAAIVCHELFHG